MTLPDLTTYSDDDLEALRVAVLTEQDRRTKLAQIPQMVTQLTGQFMAAGGAQSVLTAAVTSA